MTRKRRGSPKQGGKSPISSPLQKQTKAPATPTTESSETPAVTSTKAATNNRVTSKVPDQHLQYPQQQKKKKKFKTNINLKRRRDSGDGAAKKLCPEKPQPEAGPSHQTKPQLPPPAIPSTSPPPPPPKITLQSPPQRMAPLSPLSPQQEHLIHKHHRPYKIPLPRPQSAERAQPSSLARTPSLPSLSPSEFSSQNLFPAIPSPKRKPDPPAGKKKPNQQEDELSIEQMQRAAALCSVELEAVGDFQLRKARTLQILRTLGVQPW